MMHSPRALMSCSASLVVADRAKMSHKYLCCQVVAPRGFAVCVEAFRDSALERVALFRPHPPEAAVVQNVIATQQYCEVKPSEIMGVMGLSPLSGPGYTR